MLVPVIVRRVLGGDFVSVRPVSEALGARIVADMVRNGAGGPERDVVLSVDDARGIIYPAIVDDVLFWGCSLLTSLDLWTLRQLYGYSDRESERRFR